MCKKTKKIISFFLTASMLFSLSGVPAFAEETEITEVIESVEQTEAEIEEITVLPESEETAEETNVDNSANAEESTNEEAVFESENTDATDELQTEETKEIQLMSSDVSLMSATSSVEGDGTAENPYLMKTEADLLALANEELTNSLSANYVLQNDIIVTSTTWVPIGNHTEFSGHFDGNGYTISGVILEGSGYTYTGFFGKNSGLIENVTVDVTFSASNYLGGLVAYNTGTIRNCLTKGTANGTSSNVGGLVGDNNNGTINTSGSTAVVTGSSNVGGLVGRNYENGKITNCYAQGNVTGSSNVGGLVGYNDYYSYAYCPVIRNCYAAGKVNDGEGAGLVGKNNSGRIYNSYYRSINTGNMIGYSVSTTNMKNQDTFYMWDFDNIWEMNGNYPYINVRGETEAVVFDGAGTEVNPYLITTEKQLYELAKSDTYMRSTTIYFRLANDITITAKFWTPIGEYNSFDGVFDGNGYTISGVKHSGTNYEYVGLFGSNAGTIKNLTVNGDVSGQSNVGILTGYNSGTIENCLTKGTANGTSSKVGGLVGENSNGTISTSGSTAVVTGSSNVGGLVGRNYENGKITNCYAQGNVTGSSNVGGLVGYNDYYSYAYCPVVQYCYSIGVVSSNNNSGGLIGYNQGGLVTASYYNSETSGQTDTVKGTPATTEAMKIIDNYAGWDFDKVWAMSSRVYGGYPYLQTMIPVETISVTGVTLNKSALSLIEGNSETLTATVTPDNATNKGITWTSSNTNVAIVSNGKVTAKTVGTTTITVTTVDGGYTASCNVTVTEKAPATVAVTGVTLNKSAVSLEKDKTETLTATVTPTNATNTNVTWKSSNTSVATISNGIVTAKSAGTAVITVTTADGGYAAECTVTVTEKTVDTNAPKIAIADIKTIPGKEIQVTVDLANNKGFVDLGIEVGYNSDVMTLTGITANSGVGATFTSAQSYTANPYNFGWSGISNITYNGNLATLTFTVAENASDGVYPITVDYYKGRNRDYKDGEDVNYDENDKAVGFVYISGNVIVASYIPGDINGDEKVNNKDATQLLRYLAGWSLSDITSDALDVDGSGSVNNKDATHLLRYLAGWNVTLH